MEEELLIKKVKQAHKDYCEREFGDDILDNEIYQTEKEENVLDLMYTTINDDEWEVQVSYNLADECLITSLCNGEVEYIFKEVHLLKNMLQDLQCGDFQGWYSYAHDVCDEHFNLNLEW